MAHPAITNRHADGASRAEFELTIDNKRRGHLDYTLPDPATMVVEYVEVDPSLRGQGMGERLVGAAVEWARANRRRIVPLCSYARAVMTKTDAYQDVLRR